MALLAPQKARVADSLAALFGLRHVENTSDVYDDDFGEWQMSYDEGRGFAVYKNDYFKFKVRQL
ncbi:MAG: hypothetical protein AB7N65_21305 [Vicinamibacterales bacterium]